MKKVLLLAVLIFASAFATPATAAEQCGYELAYDRAFQSSDHGITVKFYVKAKEGVKLAAQGDPSLGPVYMPTYISMELDGKIYCQGPVSMIDEPRPYILYGFEDEAYEKFVGTTQDVVFHAYGHRCPDSVHFGAIIR